MKKICLIVLFMSVVLLMGCTKPIPEEELEEIIADYEDIKASKVDIESIEESKNEIIVEAELNIKEEDIGYKTVIEYTLEKKDGAVEIEDVDVLEDREYYPLQSCDFNISLDEVIFEGLKEKYSFSDSTNLVIIEDDINLKNAPYYEQIDFEINYEDEFCVGQGYGEAKYIFDSKYGKWSVEKVEQTEPVKLNWKEGNEFTFHENDLYEFLKGSFFGTDLIIADDMEGIEISIDDDDVIVIDNITDILISPNNKATNAIHVVAENGVIKIDTDLKCNYEYNRYDNKWVIESVEVVSVNEITLPDLLGKWVGYHYDKDRNKKYIELIVDSKIGSSGDYIAYVNFYDSYDQNKSLIKKANAKITFNDWHISDGMWIEFENREPYEWVLWIDEDSLTGEYFYGYSMDYNEIKLNKEE